MGEDHSGQGSELPLMVLVTGEATSSRPLRLGTYGNNIALPHKGSRRREGRWGVRRRLWLQWLTGKGYGVAHQAPFENLSAGSKPLAWWPRTTHGYGMPHRRALTLVPAHSRHSTHLLGGNCNMETENNVPKDMLLNCIFFKRKIYCWGNTHDISCINSQFSLVIAEVSYSQTEFSILAPCTVLLYTGSRTVMHIYVCVYIYIYIHIFKPQLFCSFLCT